MPPDKVCKTVHQYGSMPVSREDMEKLQEIAEDYSRVKNYVYAGFGGIGGLSKIYPGYTVQNEIMKRGLREALGMPSVYFRLAIFDALGEVKSQWTKTKSEILKRIGSNGSLTEGEKHYLRYLLKVNNAFDAVLNRKEVSLRQDLQRQFEMLAGCIDRKKADNYLRRQVRRIHVRPHTDSRDGFSLAERAYRYGDHGIYITAKEKRKRIFIPLTDGNQYTRQLYLKLYPQQGHVEIKVPVDVRVRKHKDYKGRIGLAAGMYVMFTTDEGHAYGEMLGQYQKELEGWIRTQSMRHRADGAGEAGRKKYTDRKRKQTRQLHTYINTELNRLLRTEKPEAIYIPKLPRPRTYGRDRDINYFVNMWQRGYIKKRLVQKCREQSIGIVEVYGKGIGRECSQCGAYGYRQDWVFRCPACGYRIQEKRNTARNVKVRGEGITAKIKRTAVWMNEGEYSLILPKGPDGSF